MAKKVSKRKQRFNNVMGLSDLDLVDESKAIDHYKPSIRKDIGRDLIDSLEDEDIYFVSEFDKEDVTTISSIIEEEVIDSSEDCSTESDGKNKTLIMILLLSLGLLISYVVINL